MEFSTFGVGRIFGLDEYLGEAGFVKEYPKLRYLLGCSPESIS